MDIIKIGIIGIRLALGLLFVYAGIQKFIPKPPRQPSEVSVELPDHVVKIKALIGGMKQSGYFWPMLGAAEILCGLLLISQFFSLLGAVMLVPISFNILLFHAFLETHELWELALTALYFIANLLLIAYHFKDLKPVFIPIKSR
jgi:putative oxidoreductase